ncbi:MAG: SDR family NAD(P)-dependent oxidoreductase [Pseudomonadota bacterium]
MALTSLEGKTAFITGGAKGIGLGIAKALCARGANVMLADIDGDLLTEAAAPFGMQAGSVVCDVRDAQAVQAAAQATTDRFGKVHMVFNNAGVGGGGDPGQTPLEDWRWVVDINLMGVVYGVETFVPLIRSHGEGGYVVNTASMAGHVGSAQTGGPYNATKFAVVGYSETLRAQLQGDSIGCSVLCPGWVDTDIHLSGMRAPSRAGTDASDVLESADFQQIAAVLKSGLSPEMVGEWTIQSMLAGRMYIFTHPEMLPAIEARTAALHADYKACIDDPRFQPRQT